MCGKVRILLTFSSLIAIGVSVSAQSYEEFKRQALLSFAQADSAARKEYRDFRARANDEYARNMEHAWESFQGSDPVPAPVPDPVVPPIVFPQLQVPQVIEDNILAIEEVVLTQDPLPSPRPVTPIVKPKEASGEQHYFSAFGALFPISLNMENLPTLRTNGETAVAKMWKQLSTLEYDAMLADLLALRKEMDLCDWAYYELVKALADDIYPGNADPSAVFCAYVLCQSGFKLRLGRAPMDGSLHIIMATDNMMYDHPSWDLDGDTFFLLDNCRSQMLKIYRNAFPGERVMRLAFTEKNRLPVNLSDGREHQSNKYPTARTVTRVNKNLIAFYDRYPESFVNRDTKTRWRFYAVDLSEEVKETLYPSLREAIAGKTELEAANILLNYVQTGFEYEYDTVLWGYDRTFFPDETLYYPYCDCEDRSIFFSRIIRDLLGLRVALVYYPGHLATAVKFTERVPGDIVLVNGERFVVCDPTFENAPVGMTAPEEDNSTAFVMLL